MANEYAGTATYVEWIHSGGTAVLSGNYRTASYTPTMDTIDASAGADTRAVKLPGMLSGQFTLAGLMETGGTIGNVAGSILAPGQRGTIVYGPEGTVTGSAKITIPAVMLSIERNTGYQSVAEFSISFDQSGTETYGSW